MEIIIESDSDAVSKLAASRVAALVRAKPNAVLGLATGRTPKQLYAELVRLHKDEKLDFSHVTTFNLDEYAGLPASDPNSYRYYMDTELFNHINIKPERTHVPDGCSADIPAMCAAYERRIVEAGGIDLQVLGVGSGGHIGFNEPTSSFASRTRIKTLAYTTRRDNGSFFGGVEKVPKHVVTMGIGTIMESREILLLAVGGVKAGIMSKIVEGPVSALVPGSILQFHPNAKVLLDNQAASELSLTTYYKYVYVNKPAWHVAELNQDEPTRLRLRKRHQKNTSARGQCDHPQ